MTKPSPPQIASPNPQPEPARGLAVRSGIRAGSKAVRSGKVLSDGAISDDEYMPWSVD